MIKIYGASDDLVEIEGHDNSDEIGAYGHDVVILLGDTKGGLAIRISYAPRMSSGPSDDTGFGCWSAEVCQIAEDCPIPWPVTITTQGRREGEDAGNSVCVQVDAPPTVPLLVRTVRL